MLPSKVKRWLYAIVALLVALSWVPLALIALTRSSKHLEPRFELIQDMDWQPYFRAQTENPLFADGRSMRPQVPGTIARSDINVNDDHLEHGLVKDDFFTGGVVWATTFPMPVTDQLLARGCERYNIYCAPCHGYSGYGNGPIDQRADQLAQGTWTPPASLESDLVRSRPVGHIFNTITNGIRNMPSYGSQIPVEDRWAIIAYVRALERSQHASAGDLSDDVRVQLGLGMPAAGDSGKTDASGKPGGDGGHVK